MNESVLETVLTELLEEVKEIRKEQSLNNKAVELYTETINNFEEKLNSIKVETPSLDLKPLEKLIGSTILSLNATISQQPKEVLHEKRILFYPEGNGENFLKLIFTRLIWTFCIIGTVWIIIKAGGPYYKENSENARYKQAFQWVYLNSNSKGQNYLIDAFQKMNDDSIREIRIQQIENYFNKYPQ